MDLEPAALPPPSQTTADVQVPRLSTPSSSSSPSLGAESDRYIELKAFVNTPDLLKHGGFLASSASLQEHVDQHDPPHVDSIESYSPQMELIQNIAVNNYTPHVETMQNHPVHVGWMQTDVKQHATHVEANAGSCQIDVNHHSSEGEPIHIDINDHPPHVEVTENHIPDIESLFKNKNNEETMQTNPNLSEISPVLPQDEGFPYSGPLARRCVSQNWDRLPREKNATLRTRSAKWHYGSSSGVRKEDYLMFRTRASLNQSKRLHSQGPYEDNMSSMPAGRYFDALEGPDFEILKDPTEPLLLPDEKWPFLLRFPIVCYGVCLGLGSQAMLWKALATSSSMRFLKVPLIVNFILWCLTATSVVAVSIVYAMKCVLYFEAVRREYFHPVRVNFLFAPWIACMFLLLGIPPRIASTVHPAIWCVLVAPLLVLSLKIHGQWPSGGERRLSNVANPSIHLSLAGYFVSALLAATVGWKEPGFFLWAVGCAHYMVVFVTLYQRLPTAELLPKELHPIFFLFVAAPSAASLSWKAISGSFDRIARVPYFIALFLYASLVVRFNFFCGFRFSIAWWAYTFPMASSAIATIEYSMEVHHAIPRALAVILSLISVVTTFVLFVVTILHASMGTLFPNDLVIAITRRRQKRKNLKRQGQDRTH